MVISIIVAAARNGAIGKDNKLLWHISADLKRFKSLTIGHTIIMGRKTFESIGKALPNRQTIIISRNTEYQIEGCITVDSLEKAIELCKDKEEIFICGGGEIYKQALPLADKIYFTSVEADFEADTFFSEIDKSIWSISEEIRFEKDDTNPISFTFQTYLKNGNRIPSLLI